MFERRTLPIPSITDHPVDVGLRTEVSIAAELINRGYRLLVPVGANERYDLALDLGEGRMLRAQCKTGRVRNGCVKFSTRSTRVNTSGAFTRDYHGEADVFLVRCEALDRIYCVPVDETPKREMSLRIERCRNGQEAGVRLAADYELTP